MNYLDFLMTAISDEKKEIEAQRSAIKNMTEANEIASANAVLEVKRQNLDKLYSGVAALAANANKDVNTLFNANGNDGDYEYRKAQMEYIVNGTVSEVLRDSSNISDNGLIVNETLYNKIITKATSYGKISSLATHLHIKGGIRVPRGMNGASVTWGDDTVTPDSQALKALGDITFAVNKCMIRVERTELHTKYIIDAFEDKLAEILAQAMCKAEDYVMFNGKKEQSQPIGILVDEDIVNEKEFTAEDFANYLSHKGLTVEMNSKYQNGLYVMTASTFASLMRVQNAVDGAYAASVVYTANGAKNIYDGKEVILVENDILPSWDTCEAGECFAVYLKPSDYWFNLQENMIVDTYQDKKTRNIVTDVVLYIDGRMADPYGVLKLVKAA